MDAKVRIILAEDECDLRESMVEYLNHNGFEATGVGSSLEFYRALSGASFSIAVIDVGLPDQNGFILAEYIRKNTAMGVIIVTARDEMQDRLQGYVAGADLYLTKPVDCRELTAAIRNLAVRLGDRSIPSTRAFHHDSWTVTRQTWHLVTPTGLPIRLTAKEMQFMTCLAETPDQPVNRARLLDVLGYSDDEYANRAMDSLVRRLRRKIKDMSGLPSPIKTINAVGYSFPANIVIE